MGIDSQTRDKFQNQRKYSKQESLLIPYIALYTAFSSIITIKGRIVHPIKYYNGSVNELGLDDLCFRIGLELLHAASDTITPDEYLDLCSYGTTWKLIHFT